MAMNVVGTATESDAITRSTERTNRLGMSESTKRTNRLGMSESTKKTDRLGMSGASETIAISGMIAAITEIIAETGIPTDLLGTVFVLKPDIRKIEMSEIQCPVFSTKPGSFFIT